MKLWWLLFSGEGRLSRRPFWLARIGLAFRGCGTTFSSDGPPADEVVFAVQLATLWPVSALMVKRLHDLDRDGWFGLLLVVPIVDLWVTILPGLVRGTAGQNRFGEDPLAHQPLVGSSDSLRSA